MTGMYHGTCDYLYCIENLRCCTMGAYNGNSFAETPKISINVQNDDGSALKCSIDANDQTTNSDSYSCQTTTDLSQQMTIGAASFSEEFNVNTCCFRFPNTSYHYQSFFSVFATDTKNKNQRRLIRRFEHFGDFLTSLRPLESQLFPIFSQKFSPNFKNLLPFRD